MHSEAPLPIASYGGQPDDQRVNHRTALGWPCGNMPQEPTTTLGPPQFTSAAPSGSCNVSMLVHQPMPPVSMYAPQYDLPMAAHSSTASYTIPAQLQQPVQPSSVKPPSKRKKSDRQPKKRIRDPDSWKKNIIKKQCNSGEEHVNAKGKIVPAKTLGPGCGPSCRMKCQGRFSIVERKSIFDNFWHIGDREGRRRFVQRHLSVKETSSRLKGKTSRKANSILYFLPLGDSTVRVCKIFYLHTLCVTDSVISTAIQHGSTPCDKCGRCDPNLIVRKASLPEGKKPRPKQRKKPLLLRKPLLEKVKTRSGERKSQLEEMEADALSDEINTLSEKEEGQLQERKAEPVEGTIQPEERKPEIPVQFVAN